MMMKKMFVFLIALMACSSMLAQDIIKLPNPNVETSSKMTLMQALQQRKSVREYSARDVTNDMLSVVLWAACGYNRPEEKRITAPSAINAQDIEVYVCCKDGAFLYNPAKNQLEKVSSEDLRYAVAGRQSFAKTAPLCLVLVSNLNKFRNPTRDIVLGAMDAGYVSENICLTCTALGLATVPRATMDKNTLSNAFGLKENQVIELNHPIGWPK